MQEQFRKGHIWCLKEIFSLQNNLLEVVRYILIKFDFLILHADWHEVGMQYYRSGGAILLKFCPSWQNLPGNILSWNSPTFDVNFEQHKRSISWKVRNYRQNFSSKKTPSHILRSRGAINLKLPPVSPFDKRASFMT